MVESKPPPGISKVSPPLSPPPHHHLISRLAEPRTLYHQSVSRSSQLFSGHDCSYSRLEYHRLDRLVCVCLCVRWRPPADDAGDCSSGAATTTTTRWRRPGTTTTTTSTCQRPQGTSKIQPLAQYTDALPGSLPIVVLLSSCLFVEVNSL